MIFLYIYVILGALAGAVAALLTLHDEYENGNAVNLAELVFLPPAFAVLGGFIGGPLLIGWLLSFIEFRKP